MGTFASDCAVTCSYDNRSVCQMRSQSKNSIENFVFFWLLQVDCLFMAMMRGGERGGKEDEASYATRTTIWITQEISNPRNDR